MPTPHDSVSTLSTQLHTLMQSCWNHEVLAQLPADVEQQARATGAFVRVLRCAMDLLRGLQASVLCAPSFFAAPGCLGGAGGTRHPIARGLAAPLAKSLSLAAVSAQRTACCAPVPVSVLSQRIVLIDATRLGSKRLGAPAMTGARTWVMTCWWVGCSMSSSPMDTPPRA